jgi:hypothetical protein
VPSAAGIPWRKICLYRVPKIQGRLKGRLSHERHDPVAFFANGPATGHQPEPPKWLPGEKSFQFEAAAQDSEQNRSTHQFDKPRESL